MQFDFKLFKKRPYIDRTFWVLYIMLIGVAAVALFSATSDLVFDEESTSIIGPVGRQICFLLAGCVLAYVVQFIPSRIVTGFGYLVFAVSLLLVYSLLWDGNPLAEAKNGAARWIKIGVTFQPAELAKLGLLVTVADLLTKGRTDEERNKYFWWTVGLTVAACFPIMVSNMSTAVLLAGIVFLMWILARVPWKKILIVAAVALSMGVSVYMIGEFFYVRPGKKATGMFARITVWAKRVDDFVDERKKSDAAEFRLTDENRQRSLAKVAVMRGGKTPFGVGPGNSQERDYLPLAYEDYIFAIIVEESGIIGAVFLIFIYLAILFRACFASSKFYGDQRAMLTVMGLALMITCQAFVSMAVSVGLGPVTGQPLPLISHGGTSAIVTSLYFGMMMGVSREQEEMRDRQHLSAVESEQDAPEIILQNI
ncbi:MAG: FtsW/RodA/SpoVE family cell cycle protein [Paludibacteraceae bacterium]|nr:FtsW/RodA/SpoVE family cell cycle protein [Paludibacteraceae bacterium]